MSNAWSNPGPARELLVGTPPNSQIVITTDPVTDSAEIEFDYNDSLGELTPATISTQVQNEGNPVTERGVWTLSSGEYGSGNPSTIQTTLGNGFEAFGVACGGGDLTMDTTTTDCTMDFTGQDPTDPTGIAGLAITAGSGVEQVDLNAQNSLFSTDITVQPTGFKFGAGERGQYYAEHVNLNNQVFATAPAAATALTNFAALHLDSDYGSFFNLTTGVWTCGVTGWYEFTASVRWQAWVSPSGLGLFMVRNGGGLRSNAFAGLTYSSQDGIVSLTANKFCNKNDVVIFSTRQATGVNQTVDNANDGSYIIVRRKL